MDIIFEDLKNWINSKIDLWKEQGLIIDEIQYGDWEALNGK
ncbi:hypothetical protein [Clostridium yunnanense]|nr:hypothetical protein [Clostridium yunnanense]